MNYTTKKNFDRDQPAEGFALLARTESHFRRSANGAWLGNGSTTETFEIPVALLNSREGSGWLNPGRTGYVALKFPNGDFLSVDGANDPLRAYGFGDLGYVTLSDGRRELVCKPGRALPNLACAYYRVTWLSDAEVSTFEPLHN